MPNILTQQKVFHTLKFWCKFVLPSANVAQAKNDTSNIIVIALK